MMRWMKCLEILVVVMAGDIGGRDVDADLGDDDPSVDAEGVKKV